MKAIVFPGTGKFLIKEVEIPEVGNCEVLLKNNYAGLCGTDIHIFNGEYYSRYPLIPGHEFSGVVVEKGKNVNNFKKGDRVAVQPNISCNKCYYCKKDEQNFCENMKAYGVDINGGFAQYTKVKASNLYDINGLSMKEAALLEPLSCVIYGINSINVCPGDRALVFGGGSIGLLLLQMLKIKGVSSVTVIDINNKRKGIAESLGADGFLINDESLDKKLQSISRNGFDILVDATGKPSVCEQLMEYADNKARILFYGVCPINSKINIDPFLIFRKSLSIHGAFSLNNTMPFAIELAKGKKINLESLISHELTLDDFGKALSVLKKEDYLKIIFSC
jgi:D-arabinitol dehydrogenase (NADP+)